jgi:hypothetical protein
MRAVLSRRAHVLIGVLVSMVALVAGPIVSAPAALAQGVPVTYKDFVYPSAASAAPTQDKPQSKLWYQAGAWWAVMATPSGSGVGIFELTGHVWRNTGVVVDNRPTSTADTLWQNNKLYVASRTSSGALRLYRLSYLSGSRSYSIDTGFPVTIAGGGTESITVARDSAGRLWTTWTQASKVYMAYSTSSDTAWSSPVLVPASDVSVSSDDISAVIATGSIVGIMWSDQASTSFRFAVHQATSAPTSDWTMETPLSGTRLADDHLNLKSLAAEDNGRIHAVVKTSLGDASTDKPTDPSLIVLTRTPSGTGAATWSQATVATVADKLTRPQILLDETHKDIYVVMTTEGGGTGYYKKSSLLPTPSFGTGSGKGAVFMSSSGAQINDLSTTKDPVNTTTGVVAIGSASNIRTYFHTEMSLG